MQGGGLYAEQVDSVGLIGAIYREVDTAYDVPGAANGRDVLRRVREGQAKGDDVAVDCDADEVGVVLEFVGVGLEDE